MSDSATPWTAASQVSISLTISWSLPKFMCFALVMPSSHLILWHPLLLFPSIFPSIRDFSKSQLFISGDQSNGASVYFYDKLFKLWLSGSLNHSFTRCFTAVTGVSLTWTLSWHMSCLKKVKSLSHVWLFVTPQTVAHLAPPSMGFSRQEYWSGLPFPSPGYLPDPGIEPRSPTL